MTRLPNGIWVVVAGTSDAEIFVNLGDDEECHLRQIPREFVGEDLTRKALEDVVRSGEGPISGEPFQLGQEASDLIDALERANMLDQFDELVITAPAGTLELLRNTFPQALKDMVTKALTVELSGQSFDLIEQRILNLLTVDDAA